jgi:hypothetical protein
MDFVWDVAATVAKVRLAMRQLCLFVTTTRCMVMRN